MHLVSLRYESYQDSLTRATRSIRVTIFLAYDFCSDFLLTSPAEITVELSRSVESLLQRNLRTIMEQSINRENAKDLTLTQILQFVTNLSYMEKSVRDVETNIRSHSTGMDSFRALWTAVSLSAGRVMNPNRKIFRSFTPSTTPNA